MKLALLALALAAILSASEHRPQNVGLPLVHAGACAPLPNPCDKIDCKRGDTRKIV